MLKRGSKCTGPIDIDNVENVARKKAKAGKKERGGKKKKKERGRHKSAGGE